MESRKAPRNTRSRHIGWIVITRFTICIIDDYGLDASDCERTGQFKSEIIRWQAVGGAIDSDGNVVKKPAELIEAELIVRLCERFKCLPSQLLKEDVSFLRMIKIEAMTRPQEGADYE